MNLSASASNSVVHLLAHMASLDHQIVSKESLRFSVQETAEEFATAQYGTDFIPRSVIRGATGLFLILENPTHVEHEHEVFFINSIPGEG